MSWQGIIKEEPKNFMRGSNVTWEDMREDSANALRSAKTINEKLGGVRNWLSEVSYSLDKMLETRDFREITEQLKDVDKIMELVEEMTAQTEELEEIVREMGE